MNYIAVGDIHGRFDLMERLLTKVFSDYPKHTLLFLGDYVDRGPDSYKVVDTIKQLVKNAGAIAVRGNHETMMLDYSRSIEMDSGDLWFSNGGRKTVHSYQEAVNDYTRRGYVKGFMKHRRFLESMPIYFETDELWASHAPIAKLDGETNHHRKSLNNCTWTYHPMANIDDEGTAAFNHGKLAVCGHIHRLREGMLQPRIFPHIIYTDTGCGCATWGPLTGVRIEDGKFIDYFQVKPEAEVVRNV